MSSAFTAVIVVVFWVLVFGLLAMKTGQTAADPFYIWGALIHTNVTVVGGLGANVMGAATHSYSYCICCKARAQKREGETVGIID